MADEEQIGPTRWDSVLFDRRKYEDRPDVVSLRDDLFASLRAEYPTMRYVSDTRETLALVLVNLCPVKYAVASFICT